MASEEAQEQADERRYRELLHVLRDKEEKEEKEEERRRQETATADDRTWVQEPPYDPLQDETESMDDTMEEGTFGDDL